MNIFIAVFAVSGLFAVTFFYSCKKEKNPMISDNLISTQTIVDLDSYLIDFKKKMQSNLKSSETIELENAKWHLSSLLNFTYGDANYILSEYSSDTFYISMPIIDNQVSLPDLNEAYLASSEQIEQHYYSNEMDGKKVVLISSKITSSK